jgi:hypothetical protein
MLRRAATLLRSQLLELPVANVGPVIATSAPAGTKPGPEAVALGALSVSLPSHVIPELLEILKGWMNNNPDVTTKIRYSGVGEQVEVELDPARMSREEIAGLLDTLRKP